MISRSRSMLSPLFCALLLLATTSGVLAASPRLTALHRAAHIIPVTVSITTTGGTVWGTVTAKDTFRHRVTRYSCATAMCKLRVPRGVILHLNQVATDSATWPFKDWKIKTRHGVRSMKASAIAIRVTSSMSVAAIYVVAGTQASSSGSGSNYP